MECAIVFYDNINMRCGELGISVSKMLLDVGMSKSTATKWKDKTYEPSNPTKKKIADYFGITVAQLMSGEIGQKETATQLDDGAKELASIYSGLSAEGRKQLEDYARLLVEHEQK